ncbi:hypothetical protein INT44_003311 [Umbelopsis vinacea]|uniref:SCP domain-containing protein n=1 Tax=Umbelopsis vinacea TaxID=44442 RepID=A0A8H7Q742_9FUNG|nr:hypothetical protein INT44_003311 [Umbelopsis vinacea]
MLPITAFVLSIFAFVPSLAATTVSQADQAAILSNHNLFRSRIGAPFLVWNATVADFAENWVNQCINGHSNSPIYGENMGYGYNTWNEMVDAWIEEVRLYNPNTEDLQPDSLHYTQAVWKSTVSIEQTFLQTRLVSFCPTHVPVDILNMSTCAAPQHDILLT